MWSVKKLAQSVVTILKGRKNYVIILGTHPTICFLQR
jgi:hypothetical protein